MASVGEQFGTVFDSIFGGSLTIILWVIVGFVLIAVGGAFVYYFFNYRRKFDITVKIHSRRSGKNLIYFDKGAILRDKKNNTDFLKLWKSKVELELPSFDIMHSTNKGDLLEIVRDSERGFRFLTPPVIDKVWIIKKNGKKYPMARMKHREIESDITWILERLKVNKNLINPESFFMKLLEYAPQIISMAVSLVLIMIIMRAMPEMLGELRALVDTLKDNNAPVEVIGSLLPLFLWKKKI